MLESTKRIPSAPPAPDPGARPLIPANVMRVELDTTHFIRREQFDRYMTLVERFLRAHRNSH